MPKQDRRNRLPHQGSRLLSAGSGDSSLSFELKSAVHPLSANLNRRLLVHWTAGGTPASVGRGAIGGA